MRAIRELFNPESGRAACVTAISRIASCDHPAPTYVGLLIVHPVQLQDIYASVGYKAGMHVITDLQAAAKNVLRGGDVVLPLDDGKLAIILSSLEHPNHAYLAANKVRNACEQNVNVGGREIGLRLRIGIATLAQPCESPESLLQQAELALRDTQESDHSVVMWGDTDNDPVMRDWTIEKKLSSALANGDLELYFQPKIDIKSRALCGAEGLLRWERERIFPDVFIPLAEKTGQIKELTRFAVQAATRQLAEWPTDLSGLGVAVNLSAADLHHADLPEVLSGALDIWGVGPERLTLEVTETVLMADSDAAHAVLTAIRDLGCRVSIDDFGTGYSSLAYFKKIPADELKIDKSFVSSMLTDAGNRSIVSHVIGLAHSFGLKVVAEGVENEETFVCLSELNCDYAQGFHFSKALSGDAFVEWAQRYQAP